MLFVLQGIHSTLSSDRAFPVQIRLGGTFCPHPPPPFHPSVKKGNIFKVTVQFERCFRLMEHISVISCRNPINLYITEKLIKFSKSLFNFYLVISNI